MPEIERHNCQVCEREVGLNHAGALARHKDPHTKEWCPGLRWSEAPVWDLPDRAEPSLSGPDELATWWRMTASAEIDMVVGKAVEYGATDLRDLGRQVLEMAGRNTVVLDAEATEIGIAFYAAGKLARIMAAVKEGRRPSHDSWLDLGIYARMAQRVHSHGGWPAIQVLTIKRFPIHVPMTEQEAREFEQEAQQSQPLVDEAVRWADR